MSFSRLSLQSNIYNNQKERALKFIPRIKEFLKTKDDTFEFIGPDEPLIIRIKYLGRRFDIRCEIPNFSDEGFVELNIATYMDLEEKLKDDVFVFAVTVDQDGRIEESWPDGNFAARYLDKFAAKIRAKLIELNKPIVIR